MLTMVSADGVQRDDAASAPSLDPHDGALLDAYSRAVMGAVQDTTKVTVMLYWLFFGSSA